MNNIKLLTATLLASAITLSAVPAPTLQHYSQLKIYSISSEVANILQKRGIDEDSSKKIASDFFTQNEIIVAYMVKNIENASSVLNEKEILEYLSTQALHKKTFRFDSYASLVSMAQKIYGHNLSESMLKELENIAVVNSLYLKAVA